jgi:superfamily II DNA/RNA helicase
VPAEPFKISFLLPPLRGFHRATIIAALLPSLIILQSKVRATLTTYHSIIPAIMSLLDPSVTFATLADSVGLDLRLRKAVSRLGHVRPTLVQSKCLPLAISSGRDLLVRARTGSGKTLAYCLPLLQKILHNNDTQEEGVRAVILVPTRELCTQVFQTLQMLTYYCDEIVSLAVLSGGRATSEKEKQELARQEAMLRDLPKVIVATPAGLLTHVRSGVLDLSESVETLVVDEADLVLSFGTLVGVGWLFFSSLVTTVKLMCSFFAPHLFRLLQ